jgi:hypothetical protein
MPELGQVVIDRHPYFQQGWVRQQLTELPRDVLELL